MLQEDEGEGADGARSYRDPDGKDGRAETADSDVKYSSASYAAMARGVFAADDEGAAGAGAGTSAAGAAGARAVKAAVEGVAAAWGAAAGDLKAAVRSVPLGDDAEGQEEEWQEGGQGAGVASTVAPGSTAANRVGPSIVADATAKVGSGWGEDTEEALDCGPAMAGPEVVVRTPWRVFLKSKLNVWSI